MTLANTNNNITRKEFGTLSSLVLSDLILILNLYRLIKPVVADDLDYPFILHAPV